MDAAQSIQPVVADGLPGCSHLFTPSAKSRKHPVALAEPSGLCSEDRSTPVSTGVRMTRVGVGVVRKICDLIKMWWVDRGWGIVVSQPPKGLEGSVRWPL